MKHHTHLTFPVIFDKPTASISGPNLSRLEEAVELVNKLCKKCNNGCLSFLSVNEKEGRYEVYAVLVFEDEKEMCEKTEELRKEFKDMKIEPCMRFGNLYLPKLPLLSEIKGEKVMIFRRTLINRMFQAMFEMFGFGASEFLKESAKKVGEALAEQYGEKVGKIDLGNLNKLLDFLISGCKLVGWIPPSKVERISERSYRIYMEFCEEWERWVTLFSITILEGVVEGFLEKSGIKTTTKVSREESGVNIYLKVSKPEGEK